MKLPNIGKAIKVAIVKKSLQNVLNKIDTPEERKVVVDNIHIPGVSPRTAWFLSILLSLFLEVITTVDINLLFSNWQDWVKLVGVGLCLRMSMWLQQETNSGTAVIHTNTAKAIAEDDNNGL